MIDEREVLLRCIEAAAKNPVPHAEGFAVSVRETAEAWARWIQTGLPTDKKGLNDLV